MKKYLPLGLFVISLVVAPITSFADKWGNGGGGVPARDAVITVQESPGLKNEVKKLIAEIKAKCNNKPYSAATTTCYLKHLDNLQDILMNKHIDVADPNTVLPVIKAFQ